MFCHFQDADKTSGGSVTKTTIYYPAAGAMLINGTLYYTLKDHLGSASVVTDSTGAVVGEQRYYPYGETRLTTGTIYTDKLFTGQREMAGLGIYHYGARFYSPKTGRFLSADTIIPNLYNPQDLNRFSYVRNNPVRYTDPTGHKIDDGCRTEGCNLTSLQKARDAQKLATLEKESQKRKCDGGRDGYCSGWKIEAKNILKGLEQAKDALGDYITGSFHPYAGPVSFGNQVAQICQGKSPYCNADMIDFGADVVGFVIDVVGSESSWVYVSSTPSPVGTWTPDPTPTGITPQPTWTPTTTLTPTLTVTPSMTLMPQPTSTATTTPSPFFVTPTYGVP